MTESKVRFDSHIGEAERCLENFDLTGHDFALRHVWVICVSSFDLYMTELVSEAGLILIDRIPPTLTINLRQVQIPLQGVMDMGNLSPTEKLLFFKERIYASVQFRSFYKPDKVSEALSYIWTCPPKEKWARIIDRMRSTGRYTERTEADIRDELTLIGVRRDLIAHSVDMPPGAESFNPVDRADAVRVIQFMSDLALGVDLETISQIS